MHEPIENGMLGRLQRVTSAFGIKWKFPNEDLRMQREMVALQETEFVTNAIGKFGVGSDVDDTLRN